MTAKKVGDWAGVRGMIGRLSHNLKRANDISLARFAIKAERIAKMHMRAQDLGWKPLSVDYLAAKIRRGESELTLIATSDYFQAVTSWSDGDKAYAGIRKNITNEEGKELANIAATHEFGSEAANIDARPLWQPTYAETFEWYLKNAAPDVIFMELMRKGL